MTPIREPGTVAVEAQRTPLPTRLRRSHAERVAGILLLILLAFYVFTSVRVSAARPLWMDEVLAAWISRFGSLAGIWNAVAHGAEFSPPTYHLLLHAVDVGSGGGALAMRLPSLVAALGCSVVVFAIVRRRAAFPFAALAAALTLELAIYNFVIQARPYMLVTACFALALLAWDRAGERMAAWRAVLIATALSLAIALHFFASLLVGVLIGMEAVRTLATRRIRARVFIALAVPVLSLAAWLPLMRSILRYNAGDTGASGYFARPTLASLLSAYGDLLLGSNAALLIGFMLIMAFALLLRHFVPSRVAQEASTIAPCPAGSGRDLDFDILTAATVAIPLVVFAASVLITKTFNERYALAAALGVAILYARLVARLPGGAWIACGLLAVSCALWGVHARRSLAPVANPDLMLLQRATGEQPIVIGEGLRYLQLAEAADPALRRRLVFLRVPGAVSSDPTDEHQVERWMPLRPDLAILDIGSFVAAHKAFYLFSSAELKDVVTNHFVQSGEIQSVVSNALADGGESWLFTVQSGAGGAGPKVPPSDRR